MTPKEIVTPEIRREVISATKQALADVPRGARNEPALKTTLLSAAAMARHMGYNRDEVMFLLRDEWRHLTELDPTTVVKK